MKNSLITLLLLLLPVLGSAQLPTINTYAGTGSIPTSGGGGTALTANIPYPRGLAFDGNGNLLIAQDSLIRKVDKVTGAITTVAGSLTATTPITDGIPATNALIAQSLAGSNPIACGKSGDLYFSVYGQMYKVPTSTGILSIYAGTGLVGDGGDGGPATSATFSNIESICIDTVRGFLYVSSSASHRVRKINLSTGIISACAGTGTSGYTGDGGPATAATFKEPVSLCIDKFGNLYIGDRLSCTIRKVNFATGIITTIAGLGAIGLSGDGGPATSAAIYEARSLFADSCGNIYIAERLAKIVRRIDGTTGIIDKIAGSGAFGFSGDGGPAWTASLRYAYNVLADNEGRLYISDNQNHRIRLVTIPAVGGTPSITTASTTMCAGPATFDANVTGGVGVSYQWYVNGAPVGSATNATYTYAPADGDSVRCVVVSAGHCNGTVTSSSNTIDMTIIPLNVPSISITGVSVANYGTAVTVNAVVSGAGSSYNINWMNKGIVFATTSVPTVTYTKLAGVDTITAEVVSTAPGCYDSTTSAKHLIVQNNVGISNTRTATVHIIPNPALDEIIVSSENKITEVVIYNLVGQAVSVHRAQSTAERINVSILPAGMYLVHVETEDGEKMVLKIMKE